MRYFLAREQDTLPNIVFDLIADSLQELEEMGLDDSPLVVPEDQLTDSGHPDYIDFDYGQCSVRIMNGELVPAERSAAQVQYNKAVEIAKTRKAERDMHDEYFTYDGHDFPLTAGAVMFYNALFSKAPGSSVNVISLTGNYTLSAGNLSNFKDAFNDKILAIYGAYGSS